MLWPPRPSIRCWLINLCKIVQGNPRFKGICFYLETLIKRQGQQWFYKLGNFKIWKSPIPTYYIDVLLLPSIYMDIRIFNFFWLSYIHCIRTKCLESLSLKGMPNNTFSTLNSTWFSYTLAIGLHLLATPLSTWTVGQDRHRRADRITIPCNTVKTFCFKRL